MIVGPTASGKSGLAVRLAKKFNGEVISADSRQVYKGLDIGTGKITEKDMQGVPHHLLDVISPKKVFSAGEYVCHARKKICLIYQTNKLPIITGGTGFYVDALVGRIALPNVPPDAALRAKLASKSAAQLFAALQKKDPARAKKMDTPSERNNKVRLIRALEIAHAKKASVPDVPDYDVLWIGISPSMSTLDKKIRVRLFSRIKAGMVAEAKQLRKKGLSFKRMRELGLEYRWLADFLQKKITKEHFIESLYSDIRRYARKQTGYWNRNTEIRWFDPKEAKKISAVVSAWLHQ